MNIRCVIDGLTLHGMALSPTERIRLARVLHAQLTEQLTAALRDGWTGVAPDRAAATAALIPQQLRIDLPPQAGTPAGALAPLLGQALGQALGSALSPAAPPAVQRGR